MANFGKAVYRSLERSTQDTRDGFFCTVPRPHFLGRALIWPGYFGEHILCLFGLHPSSLSKSAEFVFLSGKASLVSIVYCYPITTILACLLFSVRVQISWKKLCWIRAWRQRWHLLSPTLYIIIVYRVNLNIISRNFLAAIRTTTTNCRVSFIDLCLVFPTNFRMVFLPHTNTVILLEPYWGNITEPGLPVSYGLATRFGSCSSCSEEKSPMVPNSDPKQYWNN